MRIKPEYADAVMARFSEAEFAPLYVEHREDGDISFWFDKEASRSDSFIAVLSTIPLEHWAIIGIVGSPIFSPAPDES